MFFRAATRSLHLGVTSGGGGVETTDDSVTCASNGPDELSVLAASMASEQGTRMTNRPHR